MVVKDGRQTDFDKLASLSVEEERFQTLSSAGGSHCEQQQDVDEHVDPSDKLEQCSLYTFVSSGSDYAQNVDPNQLASSSVESSLAGCVSKIGSQPAELWLARADDTERVEHGSDEVPATVGALTRCVEAASTEPLQHWLSTSCDVQRTNTDDDSVEAMSTSFVCLEAEFDVAWLSSLMDKVLCKPDRFWLVGCHNAANETAPPPSPCTPNVCDFLPPQSCFVTEVVANGSVESFGFNSIVNGCTTGIGKDPVGFSSSAYFASLASKPVDYWLYHDNQMLPTFE